MKKDLVSEVIKELVHSGDTPTAILSKQIRFSITLTNLQSKRLDVLTDKVNVSKQEFIARVIEASMKELEQQLDLIDTTSIDLLGRVNYDYKTAYVRDIVKKVGMTEDEWYSFVTKNT